jgi:RNA polymerase sigma-70 factor, ECF subfamily
MGTMGDDCKDFAAWYEHEHHRLVTAILLVTGDVHVAREATDEAFVRAFMHWPRVSGMASPRGWTYRVALNVVRRRGRRATLERTLLARRLPPPPIPAPAGEAWAAVGQLPARQRAAVVLRFLADLTEEEAGRVMGVSRTTVSRALTDARRTLGRMLADDPTMEVGCA